MLSSLPTLVETCRKGRTALVIVCLGLTGCCNWGLRGEEFPENDLSKLPRQFRAADPDLEPFAFSNKARQIERNLGCR